MKNRAEYTAEPRAYRLTPLSDTLFAAREDIRVRFVCDDAGTVAGLERMFDDGRTALLTRSAD